MAPFNRTISVTLLTQHCMPHINIMYIVSVIQVYIYMYISYIKFSAADRIANCLYSLVSLSFLSCCAPLPSSCGAAVAILLCSYPVILPIIITTAAIREAAHKDVSLDYHN